MNRNSQIRYLPNAAIDKEKWDRRINESANGLLYSQSFYLDGLCYWDALVMGDYEYLMPLPIRKKIGLTYVYTPQFAAQLGITGPLPVEKETVAAFIDALPGRIAYVDLLLNEQNPETTGASLVCHPRSNFILLLQQPYSALLNNYSGDAKKNIRQAAAMGLWVENAIDPSVVLALYRQAYGKLNKSKASDFQRFHMLMQQCVASGKGFTAGVKNPAGELLAGAFFGIDNKRLYYLMGAPTVNGRKNNAVYFLLDHIIKSHAGRELIFDFEGSDIVSVAGFYKKFGPTQVSYPHLVINRLPFFLQWLKR